MVALSASRPAPFSSARPSRAFPPSGGTRATRSDPQRRFPQARDGCALMIHSRGTAWPWNAHDHFRRASSMSQLKSRLSGATWGAPGPDVITWIGQRSPPAAGRPTCPFSPARAWACAFAVDDRHHRNLGEASVGTSFEPSLPSRPFGVRPLRVSADRRGTPAISITLPRCAPSDGLMGPPGERRHPCW